MTYNQHQIIAFNAACAEGSFSAAARRLGVTQSSVTQNIAKFENVIGARLFERRHSGLELTPAGRKIHLVTEEIGMLHALLEERISEYADLDRGQLRVAATASRPAMSYMYAFRQNYPGVEISFTHASWRECAAMLRGRDADVAILPEPEQKDGLNIWKIEQRSHCAIVHEGHRLENRESLRLSDLADESIVLSSQRSFARWRLETAARAAGITFNKLMTVAASPTALDAATHKLGITFAHPDPSLLAANVKAIPVEEIRAPYWVVAACNEDVKDLTLIRRFMDFIT